jgi:hypothetical protein
MNEILAFGVGTTKEKRRNEKMSAKKFNKATKKNEQRWIEKGKKGGS